LGLAQKDDRQDQNVGEMFYTVLKNVTKPSTGRLPNRQLQMPDPMGQRLLPRKLNTVQSLFRISQYLCYASYLPECEKPLKADMRKFLYGLADLLWC